MNRGEQIKQERRRRSDSLSGHRRRLAVDESQLDREKYAYRFANDEGDRLHQLTVLDDWEVVPDRQGSVKGDSAGMGTEVAASAGTGADGKPRRAVLLRKLKSYYDDDYAKAQRHIDEQEAGMKATPAGAEQANMYAPGGKAVFQQTVDR